MDHTPEDPLPRARRRKPLKVKGLDAALSSHKALIVTDEEYEDPEAYSSSPGSWSTKLVAVFLVPTSFRRSPDMRKHGHCDDDRWLTSLRARFIEIPHDRESF